MFLVIVDTTQIQSYIFASNRLRENIGASHLVAQATGQWALDAVDEAAGSHNIINAVTGELDPTRQIDADEEQQAEVIYTGGGNAVVIFRTAEQVARFTQQLSQRVLLEAPGLQLVITASEEFQWQEKPLVAVRENVFQKLKMAKRTPPASAPLLGLAVTVECQSTALPAVEEVRFGAGEARPVSAETAAKLNSVKPANERLKETFGSLAAGYEYPIELDHLGRTAGDQSHIAVVHADGDGMGKRIEELAGKYSSLDGQDNRDYVNALRAFSQSVNDAAQKALETVLARLCAAIEPADDDSLVITHREARDAGVDWIPLVTLATVKENPDAAYIPFRPVVFGGDDVTFVCDGRLGVALAKLYADEFAKETEARAACQGRLTARAGVAIVKSHYPFARAYQLSEELIQSAKSYRREITEKDESWPGSCLDWHFALSGLSGPLADMRDREYQSPQQEPLLLRPLALGDNPLDPRRSWPVMERLLNAFQTEREWAGRRNKMKALRDVLREGESAVKEFLASFNTNDPNDPSKATQLPKAGVNLEYDYQKKGWSNLPDQRCLYFDAIEMADWHISLPSQNTEPQAKTEVTGGKQNG
ncbi:MAG: hypothetical protein ABI977_13005 [Acidobacteriota bacterium]